MTELPKPIATPPKPRLAEPLILVAIGLLVLGVIIVIVGKLVILGILAILGAVFSLGTQVIKNNKF